MTCLPEIQAEVAAGALFVINHSGGKDSQAMMIKLLEIVPSAQILVVHATLGAMEWPGALELAERQAADAGVSFIVAKSLKTFLEMVYSRFEKRPDVPSFPSPQHRQCTSDLKRGPITRETRRYAKRHGFTRIVNCMGMRAAESPARAKQSIWRKNNGNSKAGRTWFDCLPIHALSTETVFDVIRDAGQEPHWAYAAGNERLSCVFCIMASKADLINGARRNPELYRQYVEAESVTGYTLSPSRIPLTEITGIAA